MMRTAKRYIAKLTQRLQTLCQFALLLALFGLGLPSFAQSNILSNGDFSTLPTLQGTDRIGLGNNLFSYAYTLPGWIFSTGEKPNLIKVNLGAPDNFSYYASGPNSDVTNPGGVGYYLDIAGGANAAYQTFTVPSCGQGGTANYRFSGYFSGRDGQTGKGTISILQGAGVSGAKVAEVTVAVDSNVGGKTTGGWFLASSIVTLTAGQTYSYVTLMDNPVNFDEAALVPLSTLGCADMSAVVDIPQASAPVGSTVNGTVSFANISANTANGLILNLQLTPGLAGVNVVSALLGTGVYNPTTGQVSFPNVPANVAPNTTLTAAISFTQPNSVVNVAATTGAINDINAPNNTGVDSVAPLAADMAARVDIPQAAAPVGSTVSGLVIFENTGANAASSPTFTLKFSPNLVGVNVFSLVLGVGAYDPVSGIVTFPSANIPVTVAPSTVITATISFTQPNSVVSVTATTGAINDTNAANNTGVDSVAPLAADMAVTVDIPQAAASVGSTVNGTVSFTNTGANTATGPTFTLKLSPNLVGVNVVSPVGAGAYDSTTGIVTFPSANVPGFFAPGFLLTAAISFTQPNSVVNVTATTSATNDTNAANNTGIDSVAPLAADMAATVDIPQAAASIGSTVNGTVSFANTGANTANGLTLSLQLSPGLAGVNVTSPVLGVGVYNAATGVVSFPNVPANVAPNTTLTAAISFTQPNSVVSVTATTSATNDTNLANNASNRTVEAAQPGSISGKVWRENAIDGTYQVGETLVSGIRVAVYAIDPITGVRITEVTNPLNRPVTDASGAYTVGDLAPTSAGGPKYEIVFYNEAGTAILSGGTSQSVITANNGVTTDRSKIKGVSVTAGANTADQNLPLDPSGVVYDSVTRNPVPGAIVTFTGPPGFDPNIHLVGGPANQSQTVGPSGFYQFVLTPDAPLGVYNLGVTPPANYGPSALIPPQPGALPPQPGGPLPAFLVQAQPGAPTGAQLTPYFLSFNIGANNRDIIHNHIPLDSGNQRKLALIKTVNKPVAEFGDVVMYNLRLRNIGNAAVNGAVISDSLPAGFRYIPGTAQISNPAGVALVAMPDPTGSPGPALRFDIPGNILINGEVSIFYKVRLGVGSLQGDGINRAQARANGAVSNEARAKVQVEPGVFTSEGCVAGKVFVDCNNNHIQDAEEVGVPGVRLYLSDGTYFITDSEGKYSYCGLQPKSHVISVDLLTMPRGSRMTTTSNRNLGDANSLFLDVKNGQLIRADFAEGSCSNTVLEQVNARRAKGEIPAPGTEKKDQPALKWESKSPRYPQQGTNSADQILVAPRPASGGAVSVPEQNTPVPQIPAASSNTRGANVRETK